MVILSKFLDKRRVSRRKLGTSRTEGTWIAGDLWIFSITIVSYDDNNEFLFTSE